jgi:hypothetical protein
MTRTDRLANAIVAVGGPDKRCPSCGTNAYALARLTLEVIDQLGDDVGERRSIFDEAASLVDGVRQEDYGDPVECMDKWAQILRLLYGWDIDAHKASMAMAQLKIVRETYTPKRDNRVDGAGYLDIADRATEPQIRAV